MSDKYWVIDNPSYSAEPMPCPWSLRQVRESLRRRETPDGTRIPLARAAYVGFMDGCFVPTHRVTSGKIVAC
jgi:hypothetical protein